MDPWHHTADLLCSWPFVVVLNAPLPQGNVSPFYDYSGFVLKMNTNLQKLW